MKNCWKVVLRCPICGRAFSSYSSIMAHMRYHNMMAAPTAPAPPTVPAPPAAPAQPVSPLEIGVSFSVAAGKRSGSKDLLPFPVKTKKRSSNKKALVVAVHEVGEPSNPPPPLPPPPKETEMQVAKVSAVDMMDLPIKKRILMVAHGRKENKFVCIICGKVFASHHALGGHKAYHKRKENKSMKEAANNKDAGGKKAAEVVHAPPQPRKQERHCLRCGRVFSSPQGLGGHRRHCKGPPFPENRTKDFDLNELPPPEEDDETLALPWYDRNGKGAPKCL